MNFKKFFPFSVLVMKLKNEKWKNFKIRFVFKSKIWIILSVHGLVNNLNSNVDRNENTVLTAALNLNLISILMSNLNSISNLSSNSISNSISDSHSISNLNSISNSNSISNLNSILNSNSNSMRVWKVSFDFQFKIEMKIEKKYKFWFLSQYLILNVNTEI